MVAAAAAIVVAVPSVSVARPCWWRARGSFPPPTGSLPGTKWAAPSSLLLDPPCCLVSAPVGVASLLTGARSDRSMTSLSGTGTFSGRPKLSKIFACRPPRSALALAKAHQSNIVRRSVRHRFILLHILERVFTVSYERSYSSNIPTSKILTPSSRYLEHFANGMQKFPATTSQMRYVPFMSLPS